MDSYESTIIKEEVSEECESESSGDDIQHVRVKIEPQLPGETKKAGPFFEVVPKVENIDVVVESSEEDNDDEKDEDWRLDSFDKNKSKRPSRKLVRTVERNKGPPKKKPHVHIPSADSSTAEDDDDEEPASKFEPKSGQKSNSSSTKKKKNEKTLKACEICGSMVRALKRHILTHTDARPHKCPECPKSFRRKWNLSNHRRTHTGEKPFKCDCCPISYQRKAHLEKHILEEHVVDKDFPCKQCEKAFINQQQLNAHIKCFHQRINYYRHACHLCSRPYREIQELKNHLRRVHSRVSYCKPCRNSFYTEKDYEIHLISEKVPFSCLECQKPFANVCLFRQHSETHPESGYAEEEPNEKDISYTGRALPRKTSSRVREKNISKRKNLLLLHSQKQLPDNNNDESQSDD